MARVGRLDVDDDPGVLADRMVYVVRRGDGVTFTPSQDGTSILAFDSAGKMISRVGRRGEAPGEFGRIRRVMLGSDDSLYISDWGLGRLTVFDRSMTLARTQPLEHMPSLILADGRMVVSEHILMPDLIGYPIHVLDPSGRVERSFGVDVPEYAYDAKLGTTRLVASTSNGTLWSVAPGRYLLEHWDPRTGARLDSFEIRSSYVTPIRKWPEDERIRPPGIIESIWVGEKGELYLLLRVADERWQAPSRPNRERVITSEEYDRTYDWVVEAVDPGTQRVVASNRFSTALWGRPSSGVVVAVERGSLFWDTQFTVWKPTLSELEESQ